MQRRTYLGGVAVLATLAAVVTGCTSGSANGGQTREGTSDAAGKARPTVPPGRYRTLPEPCGALNQDTLRAALYPGQEADATGPEAVTAALEGTAAVTYDTDRRVGCSWQSTTARGSRHLTVDLERVVSYDPAVSDNDRAAELYEERAEKADIPDAAPPTEPPADAEPSADQSADESTGQPTADPQSSNASPGPASPDAAPEPDATTEAEAEPGSEAEAEAPDATDADTDADPRATRTPADGTAPGATATASGATAPDPALAPRPLDGLAEAAYLDDELATADAGVHRDITLVFRTGNVIVTVEYDQWSTDKRRLPDSEELQEQARRLAQQLAERLDG
ncbi:hypothetical protein JJV70_11120 [Streptomyces sp. JJ66]|nr:hypothetical protein [Streptomyces sp. JJ66]